MITIKEIAEIAKVSAGTVDRVVHKRPGVSKKTAARIQKILDENNFRLNDVASKLANRKKYSIGTLLPDFDKVNLFWKSPYMGVLKAKEEVALYGVSTKHLTFNQLDEKSYLKSFEEMLTLKPDGVILVPTFKKETKIVVDRLNDENIPYLFLNNDVENCDNITFIGQDSYKSGLSVGKLMHLSLGENPSYVTIHIRQNINNYSAIYKRIQGFEDYFKKNTISSNNFVLNFDNLKDAEFVKEKINNFLIENPTVKGIYVPSSQISTIANSIDLEKLKDLFLLGHDTTERNIQCLRDKKLTFLISQKSFNQGYNAMHVMTDFLFHKKQPKPKILSPIEIITYENYDFDEEF
jgi:LacI family transcriptional regulator